MFRELLLSMNSNPNYLFFEVTSKCNAFCDFCWNWENVVDAGKFATITSKSNRDELSVAEITTITEKLPKMLVVNFYGGEPFLREELIEIVSLFIKNTDARYISFATNGFETDKILADITALTKKFPNTFFALFFSIDGPAEHHNRIRKVKNGYQKMEQTVDGLLKLKLTQNNLSISCNVNFNNYTQHYVRDFVGHLTKQNKFDTIEVNAIRGNPFDKELLEIDIDLYELIQKDLEKYNLVSDHPISPVRKAIHQIGAEILSKNDLAKKRVFKCYCGTKFFLLDDIGNVFPCETMINKSMGNIREFDYDINKLFQSAQAIKIQDEIAAKKCNCNWDCAINNSIIFNPAQYPKLSYKTMKNILTWATSKDD